MLDSIQTFAAESVNRVLAEFLLKLIWSGSLSTALLPFQQLDLHNDLMGRKVLPECVGTGERGSDLHISASSALTLDFLSVDSVMRKCGSSHRLPWIIASSILDR
ncbi:hypothetical protein TcWFU_000313 [Taenia crassiceps]|uniref:Uncharacterized protein n=1 Tax=Taenia crassiceps TaxID=6207 RepID=A0ABR4QJ25_9CEST